VVFHDVRIFGKDKVLGTLTLARVKSRKRIIEMQAFTMNQNKLFVFV